MLYTFDFGGAGNYEWIHRTSRGCLGDFWKPKTPPRGDKFIVLNFHFYNMTLLSRWAGSLGEVLFIGLISPDEICCPAVIYRYMVQIPFSVRYYYMTFGLALSDPRGRVLSARAEGGLWVGRTGWEAGVGVG